MAKKEVIEKDGVKYEVVRVLQQEAGKKVVINGLGDVSAYEKWYNRKECLEAVKRDGYALQYVREQDKEICLEAVKRYGDALQYVDKHVFIKKTKKGGDSVDSSHP